MADVSQKHFRLCYVIDVSGNYKGTDGTSRSISNAEDRAFHMLLRSQADLIVTDAATARAETYRPSRYAAIEIWSKTGDFTGLDSTPEAKARNLHALTLTTTRNLQDRVASLGEKSVLFEVGPTLGAQVVPWLDELVVTVTEPSAKDAATRFVTDVLGITADSLDSVWQSDWRSGETNGYLTLVRRGRASTN